MQKGKRHINESACTHASILLQSKKVVSSFVALFLALSLFPMYSFADESQVLTTTPSSSNSVEVEQMIIGSEPLNLIQSGSYSGTDAAAVASVYANSTSSSAPTTEQRNRIKARLNSALMNVESTTYQGSDKWCFINVADLNAPLSTDIKAYVKSLVEEVINDNPDLFYAGASYGGSTRSVSSSGTTIKVISTICVQYYYSPSTIASMKTKYETAMENVLKWVKPTSSEAEKAKAVHDWLIRNAIYNYAAYLKGGPTAYGDWSPWSAYGAIVNKSPVCEGYSLAFMAAMKRLGIQASFVTNEIKNSNGKTSGHGWNRVRIDGSWYNLDITYDDPLKIGSNNKYSDGGFNTTPSTTYFLKSDKVFKSTGVADAKKWHAKWSPAGVAGTNTKYDSFDWSPSKYTYKSAQTSSVTSVKLSPSAVVLADDDTTTLTITAAGNNVNTALAIWKSSNPSVAAVSSNGVVSSGSKMGTATITVSLGGKTAKCTVTVKKAVRLNSASVAVASNQDLSYKSSVPHKPTFVVKVAGTTLKQGTDYTVTYPSDSINPGVKTATIIGKGNYSGTISAKYTITCPFSKVAKSGNGLQGNTITVTYTGSAQKKLPKFTFSGSLGYSYELKEGTDFTVSWPNVTSVGAKKKVVVTGRGAWQGSYTYYITIQAAKSTATSSQTTNDDQVVKVQASTIVNSAAKTAQNNSWVKTSKGYIYKTTGSTIVANGWKKINGKWYYFDKSGYMQTGWLKDGSKWYYLNSGGDMATGWLKVGSTWYFFIKTSGAMAANEWREGYWLSASGAWKYKHKGSWHKNSKGWWFGDSSGWYAKSTSQKINGKVYKFNSAGYCTNP